MRCLRPCRSPSPTSRLFPHRFLARLDLKSSCRAQSSIPIHKVKSFAEAVSSNAQSNLTVHAEPWVRPDSLRETLAQHQHANRTGQATNGVPKLANNRAKARSKKSDASASWTSRTSSGCKHFQPERLHEGECVPLTTEWMIQGKLPEGLRMPWLQKIVRGAQSNNGIMGKQRLNVEIEACQRYLCLTDTERDASGKAIAEVLETLSLLPGFEHTEFSLLGSRATGLEGPLSDIDLNAHHNSERDSTREEAWKFLRKMYKNLRKQQLNPQNKSKLVVHQLRPSRMPLIACSHLSSGLNIEILCYADRVDSTEVTKAYLAEYPTLEPLFKIIQHMLRMRGLARGLHGGMSSYLLLHMLVVSLRLGSAPVHDAGSQLLEFLDLYAGLDCRTTAIRYAAIPSVPLFQATNLSPGKMPGCNHDVHLDPFSLQPQLVQQKPPKSQYLISLQDPADLTNELGRAAYKIMHVQATFDEARQQIRTAMSMWDRMWCSGLNMNTNGRPILQWCLEGNYTQYEESRQSLRRYGSDTQVTRIRG